jgi:hypothetical protein
VQISSHIPEIAYKIPDLEAFAQLQLFEVGTGELKACVQSTLSNGWSARQRSVEWSTGALAFVSLLSAIAQSIWPEALAPHRFLDLVYLYQTIASSGLLDLNYPSLYRAYTENFEWAMGLFASAHMQHSIDAMRHATGGSMADSESGSPVGLINRKLSPYSVNDIANAALAKRDTQVVTSTSSNVLDAGVPIYVASNNISTADAFMTVFFVALIALAITIVTLALVYAIVMLLLSTPKFRDSGRLKEFQYGYRSYASAWGLRLALIFFTPLTIFVFYQWTLKDSWLSVLLSVITFLSLLAAVLYPSYRVMRLARNTSPPAADLYTNPSHQTKLGPLYYQFRQARYWFFLVPLTATFVKSLLIAFAKSSGIVQIILFLIVEVFTFVALCVVKPYEYRGGKVLAIYLSVTRIVTTAAMFAFVESFAVAAIPRVAVGIVIAVIFSVAVIVLFINVIIHLPFWRYVPYFARRHSRAARESRRLVSPQQSLVDQTSNTPDTEKNETTAAAGMLSTAPSIAFHRPGNPTPTTNVPLDPEVNRPYPEVTPVTTMAEPFTPPPSAGTTTLGSVVPSRWSTGYSTGGGGVYAYDGEEDAERSPPTSASAYSHYSSRYTSARSSVAYTPNGGGSRQGHVPQQPSIDEHARS